MKNRKDQSILGRCASIGQRLFFFALLTVISIGMYAQGKTVSGTVVDKTGETVGDIPAEDIVPAYGTVTVTSETVSTYYTADGSFYVDIDANNNVRIIFSESTNRGIAFTECEYDEGTKTYTATSAAGVRYTVQMQDNGTVVIEEVPAEEVTDDTETGEAA